MPQNNSYNKPYNKEMLGKCIKIGPPILTPKVG